MSMDNPKQKTDISVVKYRKDYQLPNFLLKKTNLHFVLEDEQTIVKSKLSFEKNKALDKSSQDNFDLVLNGENLILREIKLGGISLPRSSYEMSPGLLIIRDLPDRFTLEIETEINPGKNTSLEGLYKSAHKYCTQCEAEGFRKITYYPDRPDVMSVFTTTIEACKNKYPFLLSNGNLVDSGELEGERHFATWNDPFPKPSYLFALVAGDFDLLEDTFTSRSGREIALKIYVDKGKRKQCYHAMASLKKAMAWDEEVYDLEYDLDIYMIVAVSDFNMGAMENKGLNVFNTAYVLADNKTATDADFEGVERVIAHEYFHNWTGNRVTCRDWFQLSLKEGLTVFRDQEFSSDMNSRAIQRLEDAQAIRIHQFAEDAGPMAHPIRPDSYIEMNNFYTLTVYNKGAEVIRMIHTLLGETGFQAGMKRYFERHDGQAVTCEDFIKSMEDANDFDLRLFRNWYSQAGTPEVDITSVWDPEKGEFQLIFTQDCKPSPGQPQKEVYLIPVRMALFSRSGEMMPISIDNSDHNTEFSLSDTGTEAVIQLKRRKQVVVFNGLSEKPVPSLLREFSAPVKLDFKYKTDELAMLMVHDNDSYTCWDAGQTLMTRVIMAMTDALIGRREYEVPDILLSAFNQLLDNTDKDPSLVAMCLKTPGLEYLIEQFQQVPFDELVSAYKHLNQYLASNLKPRLLEVYHQSVTAAKTDTDNAVAWRRLQNASLSLLAASETEDIVDLAIQQFKQEKGMTNSLAALKVLAHGSSAKKHDILKSFYQRWQDDALVLDKWFAVQATNPGDDALDEVESLLNHADFYLTNPNKVRALIGSFSKANLQNFHRKDGRGYELTTKVIVKLNKLNPQIAARLTSAFNHWRHFDEHRKALMENQLKTLVALENVSADVYEIASKALQSN